MKRFVGISLVCFTLWGAVDTAHARPVQVSSAFADTLFNRLVHFLPDSLRHCAIAVFPMVDETGERGTGYNIWISEYMAFRMRHHGRFVVTEAASYKQGLRYLDLSPRDPVDDSIAREASRAMKSDHFFIGTLTQTDGNYRVEARIVNSATGVILTGAGATVNREELDDLKRRMLQGKADAAMGPVLARSAILPGWGQLRQGRTLPGVIFPIAYVTTLGVFGYLAFPMVEAKRDYDAYADAFYRNTEEIRRELRDLMQTRGIDSATARQIQIDRGDSLDAVHSRKVSHFAVAGAMAAGVWGISMLDAAIAGIEPRRQFRLHFSGNFRDEAAVTLCWNF